MVIETDRSSNRLAAGQIAGAEVQVRPLSNNRKNVPIFSLVLFFLAVSLIGAKGLPAQERYPTVARLSFVSGSVSYSRGDDPERWDDAVENVPLTVGDRIYAPENSQAELQLSSGNFIRLAPRSYLSTLNLSDDIKQFYLGEGIASIHIRRLQSDEVIEIDTPNVSVTFDEPGSYRVTVDGDGNSRIAVRRGRAVVAASGRQIAVENSEIRIAGIDSPSYEIVGLSAADAFDRWGSEREARFERIAADAYRHASEDIVGAEDLSEYGRWEQIPEYGYAWTPSRVAAGWAPFSNGRWYWQDPWGWTWISNDRWGWATSHYGRWTPHGSRWYWVPVRPRTRVRYAPACVEFVRVRHHVGWFPLHPRDRHIPWWERRNHMRDHSHVTYINRNHVTVINHNHFIAARPVHRHMVRDAVIVREFKAARFTADSLPIPNRSSLRIVAESGQRLGHRPPHHILNRAAVVRTAPPAPVRTFQEKLPVIQKNQGRPLEPSALFQISSNGRTRAHPVRIRPAAEEISGRAFAPRDAAAASGAAPQPVTPARGKRLAARDNAPDTPGTAGTEKLTVPDQPSGLSLESESDRERKEKQQEERQRQIQQRERELKAGQPQKEEQPKAQLQKQRQDRRTESSPKNQPSREQRRLEELERRQAQEQEKKAQLQQHGGEHEPPEQIRRQQLQQRQLQQRQQQQEHGNPMLLQQQQDRMRREQLRQQSLEAERNGQIQQRPDPLRVRQFGPQQPQGREAQTIQRQDRHERRQQQRQQPPQERQSPLLPRQPGQP